ncbi:MAG: 3-methyl-2-oxobutanoate dehydrogenase subunit beta, partial [Clostridiales bacterium]|nr:3-methyl-2-oxobutanoate dehydrogenase subunit beta [Clostridiales bacterium]
GHSDYRTIVYAPNSVQEIADIMVMAFDKAEEHRLPVVVLIDASLGQMMEPVELPAMHEHNPDFLPWALRGKGDGEHKRHTSVMYYNKNYDEYLKTRYARIESKEQRWESFDTQDADLVLVSYGISSRICEEAVQRCRAKGQKVGLIRPISLYPFPLRAFDETSPKLGYLCVEMSLLAQMAQDVATASSMKYPIYDFGAGTVLYDVEKICTAIDEIYSGKAKEVFGK